MPVSEVGPQVPGAPGRADGVVGAGRRRRQRRRDDRAGMLVTSPRIILAANGSKSRWREDFCFWKDDGERI